MELAALTPLVNGVKLLIHVAETVTQNKSECQRLGAHAQSIVRLIWREHARGIPVSAGKHLLELAGCERLSNDPAPDAITHIRAPAPSMTWLVTSRLWARHLC